MSTQEDLDNAGIDALALTRFMTGPAGTTNANSQGVNIGTLADAAFEGSAPFASVAELLADTTAHPVGATLFTQKESATYKVVSNVETVHATTAGDVQLAHVDGPYVIVISGQSNAVGANSDGPNPASPLVEIWDGVDGDWGSSDRTLNPFIRAAPNGTLGNNNYALARAHRVAQDTGRPVRIIYDAVGGKPISEWVGTGVTSPRYAALRTKVVAAFTSPALAGKAQVDEVIFAQGEADFNDGFDDYLIKIQQFRDQLRSEPWCGLETPIYMMSPSDLHDRYQWRDALLYFCTQRDSRCIFVTSNGLRTEYGSTGSGDYTHFLGESLWEAGYHRIADAAPTEGVPTCFYGRGTGPVDATDATAMTTFSTMVSRESWTTEVPPNGPAATGSISWGHQCVAEGNYTYALGYQCVTDNVANYGMLAGRNLEATSTADFFAGFGYQNTIEARYTLVAGRGNIAADEGGVAVGMFSEYATAEPDRVMFQVGIGGSTSSRTSAIAVRKSGAVEMKSLPVFADNGEALLANAVVGSLYSTASGDLKIVV